MNWQEKILQFLQGKKRLDIDTQPLVVLQRHEQGVALALAKPDTPNEEIYSHFLLKKRKEQKFRSVIKKFFKKQSIANPICQTILPFDDYRLLLLDAPQVPEEEVREAIQWQCKDLIDGSIDDMVIDVFPVDVLPGAPKRVYAVIAERAKLEQDRGMFKKTEIDHTAIGISELPLSRLITRHEQDKPIALLYGNLNLLIAQKGQLRMMRQIGHREQLETIDQRKELLSELLTSFEFYQSQFSDHLPQVLLVAPDILKDHHELLSQLNEEFTLAVKPLQTDDIIQGSPKLELECLGVFAHMCSWLHDERPAPEGQKEEEDNATES